MKSQILAGSLPREDTKKAATKRGGHKKAQKEQKGTEV
jgi:hypothetical protein